MGAMAAEASAPAQEDEAAIPMIVTQHSRNRLCTTPWIRETNDWPASPLRQRRACLAAERQ
jgi:hypothetical protein